MAINTNYSIYIIARRLRYLVTHTGFEPMLTA